MSSHLPTAHLRHVTELPAGCVSQGSVILLEFGDLLSEFRFAGLALRQTGGREKRCASDCIRPDYSFEIFYDITPSYHSTSKPVQAWSHEKETFNSALPSNCPRPRAVPKRLCPCMPESACGQRFMTCFSSAQQRWRYICSQPPYGLNKVIDPHDTAACTALDAARHTQRRGGDRRAAARDQKSWLCEGHVCCFLSWGAR